MQTYVRKIGDFFMKQCVLHAEKVCNDCGECDDRCELDPQKICNNCFRCLETDARPYLEIPISGVYFDDDYSPEGETLLSVDPDDGFVLDTDENWKDGALYCVKTLPNTFGSRRKRG